VGLLDSVFLPVECRWR